MGLLRLAVLGPPLVEHQGVTLAFPTRKTLALLIYLSMTGGIQSRAELARLFWPDSAPTQRLTTLRSKLHALRQALGDVSSTPSPQHLVIHRENVGILQEHLELDVNQLQKTLAREVASASSPSSAENRLFQLEEATRLTRGPFLQGLVLDDLPEFDEWQINQRAYWQQQVDRLFEQLLQLAWQLRSGEYVEQIAQHWLTHDPTIEAAHRWLMQALLAQGKPAEALDIFSGYRRLAQQLHFPSITPEMEALATRARSVRIADPISPPPAMTLAGQIELTTSFELPLIGRGQESGQLIGAMHQACSGEVQVMLVRGEAGVGKTHLVTAFTDWVRAQRMEVLWGRSFETGGQLPYGPLLEALRPRLERERAPEDLLEDVWLSELSRLFPELRDRYPDLSPPLPEGSEGPVRLFEAVNLLMMAWAKRAPFLLVLDDIQWIDRATQDLLVYLLRRWKSQRIPALCVLVERLETEEISTPFTRLLTELGRTIAIHRLNLDPLRQHDVQALVSRLASPRTSPLHHVVGMKPLPDMVSFSHWLFQETEGHPLFLVHTLHELLERKLLHYRSTKQGEWTLDLSQIATTLEQLHDWVPTNVQEVIGNRLARLSPAAQNLLRATAVLGQEATFERICQVADLSEMAGLQALEEVLGYRLLREHNQKHHISSPSHVFSHDKIRAVVMMSASTTRLRLFHRRTLEVLERQSRPAATLAFHALEAGVPASAFRYSVQAGDDAMAVFAIQDALLFYTRALEYLQQLQQNQQEQDVPSIDTVAHLYMHLGRAYELVGQWEQARATYEAMLASARAKQVPRLAFTALTVLSLLVTQYEFDVEKAQSYLIEAQKLTDQADDVVLMGESAWNQAQMALQAWKITQGRQVGEQALRLAQIHGLAELKARSLYLLGFAATYCGEFEQAAEYLQAALAEYEQLKQTEEQSNVLSAYILIGGPSPSYQWTNVDATIGCLCILAQNRVCLGELQPGQEAIEQALALTQDSHNSWAIAWTRYNRNHVLLEQGAYEQALHSIQEALAATSQVTNAVSRFYALVIYGFTLQELGPLDEALEALKEALTLIQTIPVSAYQALVVPWICVNRGLAGDWQAATQYALQARPLRALAYTEARLLMMGFTSPYETAALLHGGYVEWARADVELLGRRIGANRRFRICYLRSLAVLARHDGEPEQAIAYLHEAATLAQEIGIPRECWQIQAYLAELYEEFGQPHHARAAYAQAHTLLRELANRIQDETLKRRFLEAPQLRRVLEAGLGEMGEL